MIVHSVCMREKIRTQSFYPHDANATEGKNKLGYQYMLVGHIYNISAVYIHKYMYIMCVYNMCNTFSLSLYIYTYRTKLSTHVTPLKRKRSEREGGDP
jgi:hypothetical protein